MSKAWKYLEKRFGVKRERIDGSMEEISGDYWLTSEEKPDTGAENRGIRMLRTGTLGLKPTTYGLQLLGDRIEKNIVELEKEELLKLLERSEMIPRKGFTEGYVALEYRGKIVGCGYFKDDVVSSRIPKSRSKHLENIIS